MDDVNILIKILINFMNIVIEYTKVQYLRHHNMIIFV